MPNLNFAGYRVPEHTQAALERYIVHALEPGSFLTAVLVNDLYTAALKADTMNSSSLTEIVKWLYFEAPPGSFGSSEQVKSWLEKGPAFEAFNKQLVIDILSER